MTEFPKCLLILDDDQAVARTIGFVAEGIGFTVHSFDAPEPFFEAVESLSPTHVALDLVMPGMDGVEVLRRLAQRGCDAAFILTSGMGQRVLESAQATAFERGLNIAGVLPKPFRPVQLRELLVRNDAALRHVVASPRAPMPTLEALTVAIQSGGISVAFQPKMDIASRRIVGAEVLARWIDPGLGFVAPDVFIPMAESHGLMYALTESVLDQALAWYRCSALHEMGTLAVNLSTSCLSDLGLADRLQASCVAVGVQPERLILEITESTAMDRTADCFDTLTRLRLKGFRLSVDDFGTGYSSLAQLARLPLCEIKIDKSFVMKLNSSADAHKIVDATIRLAEGMGLVSVAEGVESPEVLETLGGLGCSLAQGYHISKPLAGRDFDAWLEHT